MTDFRVLCARMADELDHYRQLLMDDRRETHALATEARAALAQPEPQGPTDEELRDLWSWAAGQDQGPWPTQQHCFARAVLARWGNYQVSLTSSTQPLPEGNYPAKPDSSPADGEVVEGQSADELIGLALRREPWATWLRSDADLMLATIARWCRPAIEPEPEAHNG